MLEWGEADNFPMTFEKGVTTSEIKKNYLDGYLEWYKYNRHLCD